jgi:glutamine amidotransferase
MKVAVINYGMGNLGSVRRALEDLGADVFIANQPDALAHANRIVLPGVGAFGEGMQHLRSRGWVDPLRREVLDGGKPMLGICLGMEMLASVSEENGTHEGLDFIPGRIRRLDDLGCTLRIPHVGWNEVTYRQGTPLFDKIPQAMDFYFVHSYAFDPVQPEDVDGTTEYGATLTATVRRGHVFGTQFHPEKSSKAGRQILRNFLDHAPC